jgi:hypothetical protein
MSVIVISSIRRLVDNARVVLEQDMAQRSESVNDISLGLGTFHYNSIFNSKVLYVSVFVVNEAPTLHPLEVMVEAWYRTLSDKTTGSSTMCVATVNHELNQLLYSNLGDCGLMVIRHIDSEVAGYMRY